MLRTRFCEMFGIDHPILQAPIWPAATPELAAAVANAGGLGSVPAIYTPADRVAALIAQVRELTDGPFVVNHVVPFLDEAAFAATLAARPAGISLSLGQPGDLVRRAHDAGCLVLHQVHNVRQGVEAAEQGVDLIIAQGAEAGGQGMVQGVGTMALVPQLVDAVAPLPVLAAGGVADGRGLAAVIALGGQGVNLGTRFVASAESAASAEWKQQLVASASEDPVRFEPWQDLFADGAAAHYLFAPRVLPSAFVEKWRGRPEEVIANAAALRDEIRAARDDQRLDRLLPFSGQTAGMIREVLPAAAIVHRLVADAQRVILEMAAS